MTNERLNRNNDLKLRGNFVVFVNTMPPNKPWLFLEVEKK